MTTKFRSACDRCHDTKVRCSGDMPCQACLVSKSLCFYSVSNPLGRPRGTKNRNNRQRSNVNSGDGSDGDRETQKKPVRRRKATKDSRSDTDISGAVNRQRKDSIITRSNSGTHTPTDTNLWFRLPDELPDLEPSTDFGLDFISPVESGIQIALDTPPYGEGQIDSSLDVAMADFGNLEDSETQAFFYWEHFMTNPSKASTDPKSTDSSTIDAHDVPKAPMFTSRGPVLPPFPPSADEVSRNGSHSVACYCLQQHAELLSNPSISEMNACWGLDDEHLSLDKALCLARQGAKTWQNLFTCSNCPYDSDQEVMLLALLSMRAVTRYLQRLAPRYAARQRSESQSSPPTDTPGLENSRLMLGSLEVVGDEKMLVFRLLFQKTVQKVRSTLHSLQMIQRKRKKQMLMDTSNRTAEADDYHASSSLLHIQQMSHVLSNALQALELSVNCDQSDGGSGP